MNGGLPGRSLSLPRRHDVPHDDLFHLTGVDAGALHRLLHRNGPQLGGLER
ncbi:MAG: hypothetical protein R6T96_02130 [Longimicrobiales bacterium]